MTKGWRTFESADVKRVKKEVQSNIYKCFLMLNFYRNATYFTFKVYIFISSKGNQSCYVGIPSTMFGLLLIILVCQVKHELTDEF